MSCQEVERMIWYLSLPSCKPPSVWAIFYLNLRLHHSLCGLKSNEKETKHGPIFQAGRLKETSSLFWLDGIQYQSQATFKKLLSSVLYNEPPEPPIALMREIRFSGRCVPQYRNHGLSSEHMPWVCWQTSKRQCNLTEKKNLRKRLLHSCRLWACGQAKYADLPKWITPMKQGIVSAGPVCYLVRT